jgi:Uma2 family endonuclease
MKILKNGTKTQTGVYFFHLREAPVKTGTTFAEYVQFEQQSQVRHEFVDGNLFVMAGATKRHNMIAGMYYANLLPVVLARDCFAYINDVIVQTPTGKGYYPDVFMTCDSSADSTRVALRPNIIIEVLSRTTEIIDRIEKWDQFQKIPSLEHYVLLSQREPIAEMYSRQGEKWLYKRFAGDDLVKFPSLEFEVRLSNLYKKLPPLEKGE